MRIKIIHSTGYSIGLTSLLCLIMLSLTNHVALSQTNVYVIPGQGADERLFKNLELDSAHQLIPINYVLPERTMAMADYARELALQIDTTKEFILIGTSLGGMLACEMSDFISPEKIIIISSAQCRSQLPLRYRFQKYVPLFEIVPKSWIKKGALLLQPIVEPDSKKDRDTFTSMLDSKDPRFLKRTIRMIVKWDRPEENSSIIHIHGDADKTIPLRNVNCNYVILNGSHMLTLTRAELVSSIIQKELSI